MPGCCVWSLRKCLSDNVSQMSRLQECANLDAFEWLSGLILNVENSVAAIDPARSVQHPLRTNSRLSDFQCSEAGTGG